MREMEPCGSLELVVGPMYSGKSEELIRRCRRAAIKQRVQVFKPRLDDRYSRDAVVSHSEAQIAAVPVDTALEMLDLALPETNVIGVDEGQFFGSDLLAVCDALVRQGKRVVVAGLELDYRGQLFGVIPQLMALAEKVDKLAAVCNVCGERACRTQRIVPSEGLLVIGGAGVYEARCRRHFEPPE